VSFSFELMRTIVVQWCDWGDGTCGATNPGMSPLTPARVLLVDDQPIVLRGLSALMETCTDLDVVSAVSDRREAIRLISALGVDLVVTELCIDHTVAFDLIGHAAAAGARVLVLSHQSEWLFAEHAVRAGARGYVEKTAEAPDIVAACRRVIDGHMELSDDLSQRLLERQPVMRHGLQALTPRELQVLRLLGAGRSTAEIGEALCISEKTVSSHHATLRRKLGARSRSELFRWAVGYVLCGGVVAEVAAAYRGNT